ncbi:unnamed protein product [Soboliphyme baturini]|uniref:PhoLip_ATPase_C domain-containing protein n=1 Tax=Soboliphyme baturini TaxID=241478 RepID=A0A183JAS4_9BILA|nr:unnamed protein product [Soboliphyme baturini]
MRTFVFSVIRGIFTSAVLFFVTYASFHQNYLQSGLSADDLQSFSFAMFSGLIIVVTAQIALDTSYWTVFNHVFIWGSVLFYFFVAIVYYQLIPFRLLEQRGYGVAFMMFQAPLYWLIILLITSVLMLPVVGTRFFWMDTRPTLSERLRIRQNLIRLTGRMSELPPSLRLSKSQRQRKASTRSSYAFSHHHGFGDLITKGIAMRQHKKNERHASAGTASNSATVSPKPATAHENGDVKL